MLEAGISLYLDENLSPKIARQLRLRGIDAVCVRDLGYLGDEDRNHLSSLSGRSAYSPLAWVTRTNFW